jgi:hypothetical protein
MNVTGFKKFIVGAWAAVLMLASGCGRSGPITPSAKSSASPTEIQINNLSPIYRISHILKINPYTQIFKMSWVMKAKSVLNFKGDGMSSPLFESTDIVYNRAKKTLKLHAFQRQQKKQ